MTQTFVARALLTLTTVFCAAYWSASLTDAVSLNTRRNGPGVLTTQQSASPTPTPPPVTNGGLPVVSPDGKLITFGSNRGGTLDLFVIAADGTGELQLTHTPEPEGA